MFARIAYLIPFLVGVPLALFFGFSLSAMDNVNLVMMGAILGLMVLPLLIRWHDLLLVCCWQMPISIFFLPGSPQVWMLLVIISLLVSSTATILTRSDGSAARPSTPLPSSLKWSLLFLAAVVLVTIAARGGIASRALGSGVYGAKKYFPILFAIAGLFAFSRITIPERKRWIWVAIFFGGTLLMGLSNFAYMAGPSFYWLYAIFPVDYAMAQVASEVDNSGLSRLSGVAFSTVGVFCYLIARFGIRGILQVSKPWRWLAFALAVGLSTVGGFRSLIVLFGVIFIVQFYYEGLFRTRMLPVMLGVVLLGGVGSAVFIQKMPLTIQRALSFLPLNIDPVARANADESTDWRLRMWTVLWNEVPNYIWLGKGYRIDGAELALLEMQRYTRTGYYEDFAMQMISGDYHSGPFSVLLSFGIFGVIAVIFFWIAGYRMLYQFYSRGSPALRGLNTFLLAYFVARIVFFLGVYGDLSADMATFCGILGLSWALNKQTEDIQAG